MELVGRIVWKEFEGLGFCSGTVRSCDSSPGFFEIVYENGVSEVRELAEVVSLATGGKSGEETAQAKPRVGRKPRKRRRIERMNEVGGDSSGNGEEHEKNEVKQVKNFDLNNGLAENSEVMDGPGVDLSGNVDLNRGCDETLGGECGSEMGWKGGVWNLRNGIDLKTGLDLDLNEGLVSGDLINVNIDYEENFGDKRRDYIDLNMDVNYDLDEPAGSGSHVQKRDRGFDLNLEVDVENSRDGMNIHMGGHDTAQETGKHNGTYFQVDAEIGKLREVHIAEVSCARSIEKIWKQNHASVQEFCTPDSGGVKRKDDLSDVDAKAVDGSQSDRGHSYEHGSGRKKRRKVLDNSNFVTETVLRRSTRRMSSRTRVTSTATSCLVDELSPSPAVSGLTEEKTVSRASKGAEEPAVLPPKPQLPPSSDSLRLDGLPLLDVFSVYACLRSFSTLLFLSPFELEDFVEALKCMSPNLLFDSIHVSLLQILRKHLEQLSTEGLPSASDCLRSLDWNMLDVVTYPLFVVEYLLFHGSIHNPGLDLGRLKLFRSEYFKQPVTLKIEILRHLCDDLVDVEAVRLELNRRSLAPEFGMEFDRNLNTEVGRKKQAMVEMEDDFSMNDEIIDDSSDWNSDECCLCKMDGSLLCCDGCPAAYHSKCVGVASNLLPEGEWYCPECAFDRRRAGLKPGKLLRGAEFLETDPHGRQYYSSCGYLLVIDTDGSESSNYYHMNDVTFVLEVLKSCGSFYSGVINAINRHWEIPLGLRRTVSNMNSQMSVSLDAAAKGMITSIDGFKAPPPTSEASMLKTAIDIPGNADDISVAGCSNKHRLRNSRKPSDTAAGLDIQNMSSEGSAETVQNGSGILSFHDQAPSSTLDTYQSNTNIHVPSRDSPRINTRKGAKSKVQSETGYKNCYIFARMTSLISEEMTRKSLICTNEVKSDEDIVSTQVKTILMKSNKFHWRNIQSLYQDAWKEKCGWCYSCKNPSEDIGNETDCLFNMGLGPVRGLPESEIASIRLNNKKGHLLALMCQVISIESRLRGLLVGPWLDPQYSRIWRESILKASNISSLKHLFVKLEANLHHRVLSSEWLDHVDSAIAKGSSVHIVIASSRSFSKSAIGKRRGRLLQSGVKPTTKKDGGLTMCWWRGGRLSRQLFNWRVLPRSLVSKAARQAGYMKIPGILYPESSEPPRRSRRLAWQAAVESSTSSEQLGLQVRELDSYIKWDDIENSHLFPALDKEARKSIRLFKKAIVRRKCLEGENVKYLLDFGKRRNIPGIVLKNGSMVEESSSGRKKFWVNESCVPLHLLKGFEEKRIARKTGKMGSSRLFEAEKVRKRSTEEKGFSYLFARAERSESARCRHCNKEVLMSEAVCCHLCQGFFHKKHARKADNDGKECSYICHRCRGEMLAKEQPKVRKRGRPPGSTRKSFGLQTQKHKKVTPARKSARVKKMKASLAEKMSQKLENHKKVVVTLPLRRSARRPQPVWKQLDQNRSTGGNKKRKQKSKRGRGRPRKVKQEISWRKKRTRMYFSYWWNGLLLSRKPSDERVTKFRRDRFFIPSENLDSDHDQPKCHLCDSAESISGSAFIACEICGEWFHGDAFGLSDENLDMLIGFRCHACRKRSSPICSCTQSTSPNASQLAQALVIDHHTEDEQQVLG